MATSVKTLELSSGEWLETLKTYIHIAEYAAKLGGGHRKPLVPVMVLPSSSQTLKLVRRYMTRISAHTLSGR